MRGPVSIQWYRGRVPKRERALRVVKRNNCRIDSLTKCRFFHYGIPEGSCRWKETETMMSRMVDTTMICREIERRVLRQPHITNLNVQGKEQVLSQGLQKITWSSKHREQKIHLVLRAHLFQRRVVPRLYWSPYLSNLPIERSPVPS